MRKRQKMKFFLLNCRVWGEFPRGTFSRSPFTITFGVVEIRDISLLFHQEMFSFLFPPSLILMKDLCWDNKKRMKFDRRRKRKEGGGRKGEARKVIPPSLPLLFISCSFLLSLPHPPPFHQWDPTCLTSFPSFPVLLFFFRWW